MRASGVSPFRAIWSRRDGSTRCTPMAPVSGPLTQGVAGTQPSARATLMLTKGAVAWRTFSMIGEDSLVPSANASDVGSDTTASAHSVDSERLLNEADMIHLPPSADCASNGCAR